MTAPEARWDICHKLMQLPGTTRLVGQRLRLSEDKAPVAYAGFIMGVRFDWS